MTPTRPMRVLMICKACVMGIYQRKLEHIAAAGVDLRVIVPPAWKDERGTTPLEAVYTQGYQLDVLPIRFNGNFHLHYYVGLRKAIQEFQPDVVHIDEEPYNVAAWQALYHTPHKAVFFSWQNIRRDYPPPFRWGERWVLNTIDYAIMGTDSAGDVWRAKGYTGPMATIPQFGTDGELFRPAESQPERPFTIGYIGRLVEEKGVHLLLDAAARLDGAWALRILGGGPQRDALAAQAAQLGIAERVTFDPQMPSTEVPRYYHHLDALVLPSLTRPNWKEQFGRVLVEAMASGVPVIGSDSGAIPGVIGDAGQVFPEGNVDALTDALRHLQTNVLLQVAMADAGRRRFLAHFTHEQIAQATVDVYRALV